jgi:hypothetical protein
MRSSSNVNTAERGLLFVTERPEQSAAEAGQELTLIRKNDTLAVVWSLFKRNQYAGLWRNWQPLMT